MRVPVPVGDYPIVIVGKSVTVERWCEPQDGSSLSLSLSMLYDGVRTSVPSIRDRERKESVLCKDFYQDRFGRSTIL